MSGRDDEFDDFLRRRKPVFRRDDDDDLEPPAELDRIVLRQAREAIEPHRPQRVFRAPRWSAPIALAATILVAMSVVLHVGMPEREPVGEVTVHNVAREIAPPTAQEAIGEAPAMTASPPSAAAPLHEEISADNGPVVIGLVPSQEKTDLARSSLAAESGAAGAAVPAPTPAFVADAEASRYAEPPPAAPGVETTASAATASTATARAKMRASSDQGGADAPAWRKDSTTWLAEIERLRAAGETARADAEMAEYNRQHRAYAGAPDR